MSRRRLGLIAPARDDSRLTIKGWASFSGVGTAVLLGSFNVLALTDNGTGDFTIQWDRDLPAATQYALWAIGRDDTFATSAVVVGDGAEGTISSTQVRLAVLDSGANARQDPELCTVGVVG